MSCQQVPTAPAFNPYPRSVQVGEFEVAIGGGIWVAIGALMRKFADRLYQCIGARSITRSNFERKRLAPLDKHQIEYFTQK